MLCAPVVINANVIWHAEMIKIFLRVTLAHIQHAILIHIVEFLRDTGHGNEIGLNIHQGDFINVNGTQDSSGDDDTILCI